GDARVDDVLAVVAGVVPAAGGLHGSLGARRGVYQRVGVRRAWHVARRMAVARVGRSEVHGRAAALAVEGARRQVEELRVDVRRDVELVAGADAGHVEIEGAGLGERGEI